MLGSTLLIQYRENGDLHDLDAAVREFQEAVVLAPQGHPSRAHNLQSLALSLTDRYRRLGDLKDLEAALHADQEVVDLTPQGHPDRPGRLKNLAVSLGVRYHRLGDLNDLQAAFQTDQEAVDLTPQGHSDRAGRLQSLSVSLSNRYWRLGDVKDIEAALQADQEAVDLTPQGHPYRARYLQSLAESFRGRYMRLGDLKDVKAALQADQEAVNLTPRGHPERAGRLQSLAVCLKDQYRRLGDLNDLQAALQADQEAVDLTPQGHTQRAGRLNNLAVSLNERYQRLTDLDVLEIALKNSQEAVEITPPGHPDLGLRLQGLAASFTNKYRKWRRPEDLVAIDVLYTASFKIPTPSPEVSCYAAIKWAYVAEEFNSSTCLIAFSNAFHLLPELIWIGHVLPLRHEAIQRFDIVKVTSAAVRTCIKYMDLPLAVELMEQGLGITFQQNLQLRTNWDGLLPDQGQKLQFLSSQLYSGTSPDPRATAIERQNLLKIIRQQPGLEYFLLPKPYKVLRSASKGGPSKTHEECFADLLAWLSEKIVTPVYQALESLGIHNGRLWWMPTGEFMGLHLHASPPNSQFIHSYIATLGSLLDSYGKKSSTAPKLGVVGVTHSGDRSSHLPGVQEEVKKILSVVNQPHVQYLKDQQATVDAVTLQLQECSWIHLACHGVQDLRYPARSRLLLYEGSLELASILQMDLSHAEFVFLAACQTAMGDAQLVNESFHLGGGFIAAGFRGAIGTLWSMNDADGPLVAESVYHYLFRDGRQPQASDAAEALQLAVEKLKAKNVPFEQWIPFIHMGV
ncbi:CHAT domain-containing protein [Mycena vulgaris]|nr:CHAT domain-containing protein [Mycena vulgaris]